MSIVGVYTETPTEVSVSYTAPLFPLTVNSVIYCVFYKIAETQSILPWSAAPSEGFGT